MIEITEGFDPHDFAHMMFNVMAVPAGKAMIEAFPVLTKYPEFTILTDLDHDSLLKYIFLLYDKKTPLKKIDDLIKRKIEAAQMAGFETDRNGYFNKDIDAAMKGFNEDVNAMIIRLLRIQHDVTFATMVTGYESLYQKLALTLSATSAFEKKSDVEMEKIKGGLWEQAKKMRDDLNQMADDILNYDDNPYLKKDLFCVIDRESEELMLSPEKISQRGKELQVQKL